MTDSQQVAYNPTVPKMSTNKAIVLKSARMSCRITEVCRDLTDTLMRRNGISESAVVEQAIRAYAERQGIPVPDTDEVTRKE